MKVLIQKELRQSWRSFQIMGYFIMILFFSLIGPPVFKYLVEMLGIVMKSVKIASYNPTPADAYIKYLGDVSQISIIVLVIMTMGIVAREKETELTGWFLTKPVSRFQYLAAKLIVLYAAPVVSIFIASTLGYFYSLTLLGYFSYSSALLTMISVSVYFFLILGITFMVSALSKSSVLAGFVGIISHVLISSSSFIFKIFEVEWAKYLPFNLIFKFTGMIDGSVTYKMMAAPILFTMFCVVVILGFTFKRFNSIEI